jgi:dihydroneopterin aldolase
MAYTRILIRDLLLAVDIGVYPQEHGHAQPVLVNVWADVDPAQAPQGYVCYDTLAKTIRSLASAQGHIDLVEALAERIAEAALAMPGVLGVTVRVEKTAALADAAAVGVEIRRERL